MKKIGTLLPLTSLVSTTHPENIFNSAKIFIDWLVSTNQSYWQLLPLHPTPPVYDRVPVGVPSPYSSYGIGLNQQLLKLRTTPNIDRQTFNHFIEKHETWITILGAFDCISKSLKTSNWLTWPKEYKTYSDDVIQTIKENHSDEIQRTIMTQFLLYQEFQKLRAYAYAKHIQLIGDMPFYLDINTPLVWSHQHLFQIDKFLDSIVSGSMGKTQSSRQIWNHPLYDFTEEKNSSILNLFKLRIQDLSEIYDVVRMDHAAGFYFYSEIHNNHPEKDQMQKGPGENFFIQIIDCAQKNNVSLIAEDIGVSDLTALRNTMKNFHIPGTSVFTNGISPRTGRIDTTQIKPTTDNIFYSSIHDTPPLLGYLQSLTDQQRNTLIQLLSLKPNSNLISLANQIRDYILKTNNTSILPLQDWLLTTDRINVPGTVSSKNWSYKMSIPIEELPTVF